MSNRIARKYSELEVSSEIKVDQSVYSPEMLMDASLIEELRTNVQEVMRPMFEQLILSLKEALNYGLIGAFFVGGLITLLAFFITFLLKEIPLRTSNEGRNTDQSLTENNNQTTKSKIKSAAY